MLADFIAMLLPCVCHATATIAEFIAMIYAFAKPLSAACCRAQAPLLAHAWGRVEWTLLHHRVRIGSAAAMAVPLAARVVLDVDTALQLQESGQLVGHKLWQ